MHINPVFTDKYQNHEYRAKTTSHLSKSSVSRDIAERCQYMI